MAHSYRKNSWKNIFAYWFVLIFLPLTLLLIVHHYLALHFIPPIQDASNNVSRVSNLGLLLAHGEFSNFWNVLMKEKNNFLSILYFSIFSALFGPGRIAWGWAWGTAAGLWSTLSFRMAPPAERKSQAIVAALLMICSTPLIFREGGLLDQRFDVFAAMLLMLSATALINRKIYIAACLSLAAIYAKGPALPVVALYWLMGLLTGMIPIRDLLQDVLRHRFTWIFVSLLAVLYIWIFLPGVMAYNLMAVQSDPNQSKAFHFIVSAFRELRREFNYYGKAVFKMTPLILPFLVGGLFLVFSKKTSPKNRKTLLWGFTLFSTVYLLFTSHPVHAGVLIAWFLPPFWIIASGIALSYPQKLLSDLRVLVGATIFCWAIILHTNYVRGRFKLPETEKRYWVIQRESAHALGEEIRKRNLENRTLRVVVNFLDDSSPTLHLNYDSYRVLLAEDLGRRSPSLEGWELGTHGDSWREELNSFKKNELFLILLAKKGEDRIHHHQKASFFANQVEAKLGPHCRPIMEKTPMIPVWGEITAYLVTADLKECL